VPALSPLAGFHAVTARLKRHPDTVDHIYLAVERIDARVRDLETLAAKEGVVVHKVERARLDRITKGDSRHQGVIAFVFPAPQAASVEELIAAAATAPLFLILDGITDPHNFGACVRSADAFGCHGVIVPKDKSAPMNEVAAKAASGALETVPVLAVTNLARAMDELKAAGVWIYGAVSETGLELQNVPTPQLAGPMAWALGAEGAGLRRLTQDKCDVLVRIPMAGSVESLNVSVATGVCLYATHAARAKGAQTPA
jgi:23S rRNA (guanosine2251-2'-O)-methyltransferase